MLDPEVLLIQYTRKFSVNAAGGNEAGRFGSHDKD